MWFTTNFLFTGCAEEIKYDSTLDSSDKYEGCSPCYPFVEKDSKKRTCAKALVMTHAYSNAIMDKVEEALKNGIVGNDDEDW